MRGLIRATPRTPSRPTYGPAIAKIAAATGTPLMPWQRMVVDVATEVLPDGSWAYNDVCITVQRQQGKTTMDGPIGMHRSLTKRFARCWYTAQTRQDARDNLIDDYAVRFESSVLSPLGKVRRSQGSEGIMVPRTGSFLRVFAPGEDDLHGKANELVVVDEHWAFPLLKGRALDQAIGPTFLSTGGQYIRHSTAGTAESVWLKEDVERGRAAVAAGLDEGTAFFELGLPDEHEEQVVAGLDDDVDSPPWTAAVQLLIDHMPAKGYTLRERVVFSECRKLAGEPGSILRAYGNRWTRAVETVIPIAPWNETRVPQLPKPAGRVAFAFACDRDRARAAILAVWRDEHDARIKWRVVDEREGTSWVADRVDELIEKWNPWCVGYDRFGPATDIGDELERRGHDLKRINYAELATSCIAVLAAVVDRQLVHEAHPMLDEVAAVAAKKEKNNRWVWDLKKSSASIATLEAGTIAQWFYDHRDAEIEDPYILTPTGV